MTLTQALLPSRSLLSRGLMVLGGSLFVALAAQVSVPMFPVPMTLQTLAILIVGLSFGSRLGAVTLAAYLAEGAMGLPVFSGGASTVALAGPTAGFLFGFVAMAWLAGLAAERGIARGVVTTALAAIAISALLYIPGLAWLTAATPLDLAGAAKVGALPFLLGDVVKAVIAALVVTGAWSALKARRG